MALLEGTSKMRPNFGKFQASKSAACWMPTDRIASKPLKNTAEAGFGNDSAPGPCCLYTLAR
jgi:hypothetical protein